MRVPLIFLVEWWYERLWREREARAIAHQQRLASPELMAMYNRPQSVVDLNRVRDRVHALMGIKP